MHQACVCPCFILRIMKDNGPAGTDVLMHEESAQPWDQFPATRFILGVQKHHTGQHTAITLHTTMSTLPSTTRSRNRKRGRGITSSLTAQIEQGTCDAKEEREE